MKRLFVITFWIIFLTVFTQAQQVVLKPSDIKYDIRHDVSIPLREMTVIETEAGRSSWENGEIPNNFFLFGFEIQNEPIGKIYPIDPVVQNTMGLQSPVNTIANFEGISNLNGVNPADPVGDAGLNYYLQAVNQSFAVYTKTGTLVYGPASLRTIWQGLGGYTSDGDPIVLYDHLANRWFISQFSLPNYPNGPYYELIAVSQTEDTLGSWYRYAFKFTNMPDYPKLGVWPDGYYLSVNSYTAGTQKWEGPMMCVLERDSILKGKSARIISFQQDKAIRPVMPADLDGPPPPIGTSGCFLAVQEDAAGAANDQLQLFQLHVDWADTAKSTLNGPTSMNTAAFDMNICGESGSACIHQKGTSRKLDALSNYLMHRLQYRNFGTYQSMVVNHTVDVDGNDHAGIRWYELRKTDTDWTIYQQGTYAPDSLHRWIGSAAMDGNGNIAVGYSISGDSLFPSIGITGRKVGDSQGRMTCQEELIMKGLGCQSGESRWGDYSSLNVDPADDETFWYTNMYCSSSSARNWTTRIASFKINDLGVSVKESPFKAVKNNHLGKNFPNPFLESTKLQWSLSESCKIKIQILDMTGNKIATPVDSWQPAGDHRIEFNASRLPAGVYICRFTAGKIVETQKLILLK